MDEQVCGNLDCPYFGKQVPTGDDTDNCCFCRQPVVDIYEAALRAGEEADRNFAEAMKDYGGD
jgi:hypothetical protein